MFLYILSLISYLIKKEIQDTPVEIAPTNCRNLELGLDNRVVLSLKKNTAIIHRIGTNRYTITINGEKICMKVGNKYTVGPCSPTDRLELWDIIWYPDFKGYYIKSFRKSHRRKYCLSFDSCQESELKIKYCNRRGKNQVFGIKPTNNPKEDPNTQPVNPKDEKDEDSEITDVDPNDPIAQESPTSLIDDVQPAIEDERIKLIRDKIKKDGPIDPDKPKDTNVACQNSMNNNSSKYFSGPKNIENISKLEQKKTEGKEKILEIKTK